MKKVPFYPNTKDNTHCYQAGLKMILKYFLPDKDFSFKQLDKLTAKQKGLWTWPTQGLINLKKMGFDVQRLTTFNYHQFIKKGSPYLIEKYGSKPAQEMIKHSKISQEIKLAKKYLKIFKIKPQLPTIKDIKKLLKQGYLVICNLNYHGLYNQPGYSGHFVVVFKVDQNNIYLHDPGLPPKPNSKIPLNQFLKAWQDPNKDSKNIQAFKYEVK